MDSLQIFKEKAINNYLSSIDMNNMNIKQMKEDLKKLLGEEPAIRLNYVQEKTLNEAGDEEKTVERLDKVFITFTINKELLPGKEMPFPITKEFIVD